MLKLEDLQQIITSFLQCSNRSEAEIRSKLAVPLIEWLEYPIECRAEEFPVYSFEGSTKITKQADFIMFDDKDYKSHDKFSSPHISWVQSHSLCVLETKKPQEMPSVLGQPQYYTIWTKAVAYIATDGITIKGKIYNPISTDLTVIDCDVKDLCNNESITHFAFDEIKKIKQIDWSKEIEKRLDSDELDGEIIDPESIVLPENTINYMRNALGKNCTGLSKGQVLEKFLRSTDFYLQQDMRYGVPPYMFDIPRRSFDALLYLDDLLIPFMKGEVYQFYRDDLEKLEFKNDYLDVYVLLTENTPVDCALGYHVLDYHASNRIYNLQRIEKVFNSKKITLSYLGESLEIPLDRKNLQKQLPEILYWQNCMNQITTIEEYYGIELFLTPVNTPEESSKLYGKIQLVYDGIKKANNVHFSEEVEEQYNSLSLEEPVTVSLDGAPHYESVEIHNYLFKPSKIHLIPQNGNLVFSVEFYPEKLNNK